MIRIRILTPEWSRDIVADAVFLPGTMGEFEVLVNHAPIISTLSEGKIKWLVGDDLDSLEIHGGIVRLVNNVMQVCVEV